MKFNKSTGGWLPFRHEDRPHITGQESNSIFTKEGLIILVVIIVLLIAGGLIYSHVFGPRPLT